jgi:hypothetical protein
MQRAGNDAEKRMDRLRASPLAQRDPARHYAAQARRPFGHRQRVGLAAALWCAGVGVAVAEHPLISEDPGTQGTGRYELEVEGAASRGDPSFGGYGRAIAPKFTAGIHPDVDLIFQGRWLSQSPRGEPTVRGMADTVVGFKWRMYQSSAIALAVRAGVDLPTGNEAIGFSAGTTGFHAIGAASLEWEPLTLLANVGYARVRQTGARADNFAVTFAILSPQDSPVRTFIEAAASTNSDPVDGRWPAVARTGLMVTVNPSVLLDIGYQARINASAPREVLLAGFTVRW